MRIGRRRAGGTTKKSNTWRNSRELERMKIVCRKAGGRTKQTTTSCKIKFWCQPTWSRTRLGGYDEICQFDEILQVLHSGLDGQAALFSQITHCFHVSFWRLTAWLDQLMDTNLEVTCCEGPGQLHLKHVFVSLDCHCLSFVEGQSLGLSRPPDVASSFAWAPPDAATRINTSGGEQQITTESTATYLSLSAYFVYYFLIFSFCSQVSPTLFLRIINLSKLFPWHWKFESVADLDSDRGRECIFRFTVPTYTYSL